MKFQLTLTAALVTTTSALAVPSIEVMHSGMELPYSLQDKANAVGSLRVYPFGPNSSQKVSCTATHIGNGIAITAGHCFLGTMDCNNAQVIFGARRDRPSSQTWVSKCLEVLAIESDESRISSSGEDFALFRISNPPPQAIEIDFSSRPTTANAALSLLSYPITKNEKSPSLFFSSPCVVESDFVLTNAGRSKPFQSFSHSCEGSGGSNGAPLLDRVTLKLRALYTSTFQFAPREQETGSFRPVSTQEKYLGKAISGTRLEQSLKAVMSQETLSFPTHHRAGFFAHEIFPFGVPGGLNLTVLTIPEQATYASFRIRRDTETIVIIENSEHRLVLKNVPDSLTSEVFTLKTPIKVKAQTLKTARSFSAEVLDIAFSN